MQFHSSIYQIKYILEHGPEQQNSQEYIKHSNYAQKNTRFFPKKSLSPQAYQSAAVTSINSKANARPVSRQHFFQKSPANTTFIF